MHCQVDLYLFQVFHVCNMNMNCSLFELYCVCITWSPEIINEYIIASCVYIAPDRGESGHTRCFLAARFARAALRDKKGFRRSAVEDLHVLIFLSALSSASSLFL